MNFILRVFAALLLLTSVVSAQSLGDGGIQQLNQWKTLNSTFLVPNNSSFTVKLPNGFLSQASSTITGSFTAATTTVGTINNTVVVNGWPYAKTGAGLKTAVAVCKIIACARILLMNGTYPYTTASDRVNVDFSNITIEGQSPGGVVLQAQTQLTNNPGFNAEGRYGMITIGRTQSALISNIGIRNITFDVNNMASTSGLTIAGSSGTAGIIGAQHILLDHVVVKNAGKRDGGNQPVEAGFNIISGDGHSSYGSIGYIDDLKIRDSEFKDGYQTGIYISGGALSNFWLQDSSVHDNHSHGISQVSYQSGDSVYYGTSNTNPAHDWHFVHNRFYGNKIDTSGSAVADYRDGSQTGVDNLYFDDNYFGPIVNSANTQDYTITPYANQTLYVTNNTFDRSGGMSMAYSVAGSYTKINPNVITKIDGNTFYQLGAANGNGICDCDASIHMQWTNNYFYRGGAGAYLELYSRHFPTTISDNTFYDVHEFARAYGYGNGQEFNHAILSFNGDGFHVTNNRFIDDRATNNPTTAPTLTQFSGGALGARTYYARYTWQNESGETSSSTNASLSVSANSLAKVTVTSIPPTGTRTVNIYVGTVSGSEEWQTAFAYPTTTLAWNEPTTGLISSSTAPSANSTHALSEFGIYEISGGISNSAPNIYKDNDFIGVTTTIRTTQAYGHISTGNTYASSTESQDVINLPWTASSTQPLLSIVATSSDYLVKLVQTGTGGYFGILSSTSNPILAVLNSGFTGIGTSSPTFLLDLYSTGTTTARLDSNSTKGSCLIMKDSDGAGYSYLSVNNGVLTASTVPCN